MSNLAELEDTPELGDGLYTFPEAARILRRGLDSVSVRQLQYWMSTGLTPSSYEMGGVSVLSFDDLVSLEVVKRFRSRGTTLQRVRVFEQDLKDFTGYERPFAYKSFFTDGAELWGQKWGEAGPIGVQLTGHQKGHTVWLDAIKTFAREVKYVGQEQHAAVWNLSTYVQIDPTIQFGAPVVRGTRVTVDTIAANLKVGSVRQVADWYGLRPAEVRGVKDYLAAP